MSDMKEISNKEIIQNLKEYFLKQEPSDIAACLANLLIDINRILNCDQLEEKERICLAARIHAQFASLHDFVKNGSSGKLKIHNFNSDNWGEGFKK